MRSIIRRHEFSYFVLFYLFSDWPVHNCKSRNNFLYCYITNRRIEFEQFQKLKILNIGDVDFLSTLSFLRQTKNSFLWKSRKIDLSYQNNHSRSLFSIRDSIVEYKKYVNDFEYIKIFASLANKI